MKFSFILAALLGLCQAAPILKIDAGDHDRLQTPVSIPVPANLPDNPALRTVDRQTIPLQVSDDGTATFILPKLGAGKVTTFELVSLPDPAVDIALAEEVAGIVSFSVAGKPVSRFIGKADAPPREEIEPIYLRGGYLHPLTTPTGNVVTDDYPANHLHHHGVWTAWARTVFQGRKTDFWNMGQGLGRVDSSGIDYSWSGAAFAGVEAENVFTDLTSGEPIIVLNELWLVKVFAISSGETPYHLVELTSTQTMADEFDLELPEYHYGGIGIRGRGEWDGKENATFLTSEGITDRDMANGKPARWVFMGGAVDGGKAGMAILSSRENFRAPQPVRIHPSEPFVSFAPQTASAMTIKHGETFRSQYRFVIMDGEVEKELLERLWNDYAEPPIATWE